ncbi:unnamed protein product [Arctia plantaginis]|uniref:Uncharacterized protein n=1 Tax=Arctia plantaginis TaxID=874455 RepID=A0A8S1AJG2_ARCPL|nr:unnamed protein product [Arctia plantaginis]
MSEDEKGVMTCAVEYKMPKGLNLDNIDNCYPQWQRFKQSFRTFIMAAGVEKFSETRKAAILLNCIGQQAQELYFNVLKIDEKAKLEDVLDVFENYFKPKQNDVINTYNFNKRTQEEGESFDAFYTAIRKMAENCNFGDQKERMIRDRIVIGVKEQRMQQKLLEVKDLTMNKAVDICRSAELSKEHLKTLAKSEVHAVQESKSSRQHTSFENRAKYFNNNYKDNKFNIDKNRSFNSNFKNNEGKVSFNKYFYKCNFIL